MTPSKAARPMPDMEKLFHSNAAPPIPKVRIKETIIMLRVLERSTLFWIKLLIPKEAIVPNKSSMIPPKTDAGMDFNKALILPKTEKTIPVTAAIRITAGLVTFVKDTAPVRNTWLREVLLLIRQKRKQGHRPIAYGVIRDFSRNLCR